MKSHQPRYAIRKYAVGAASVLIGFFAGAHVVAADTPTTTESPTTVSYTHLEKSNPRRFRSYCQRSGRKWWRQCLGGQP